MSSLSALSHCAASAVRVQHLPDHPVGEASCFARHGGARVRKEAAQAGDGEPVVHLGEPRRLDVERQHDRRSRGTIVQLGVRLPGVHQHHAVAGQLVPPLADLEPGVLAVRLDQDMALRMRMGDEVVIGVEQGHAAEASLEKFESGGHGLSAGTVRALSAPAQPGLRAASRIIRL
jgi:hypothetical protein